MKWTGGSAVSAEHVISKIDAAQCVPAAIDLATDPTDTGRAGALLTACLNPKLLTGLLGAVVGSVVYAALLVVAAVVSAGWTSISALVDQVKGDSDYRIQVSRAELPRHPAVCDTSKDEITPVVCRFVDAVRAANLGLLSADERTVAKRLAASRRLPGTGSYTIGECTFPGDITAKCPVTFDAGGSATVTVQPVGGTYDGASGAYVWLRGVPHRYGVVSAE